MGVLWYFHIYVGASYFLGFKIVNFNIFGVFQKTEDFFGDTKNESTPLGLLHQFKPIPVKCILVGFCPGGLFSQWAFVLVGFCPVGFCPNGLLS